MKDSSSVTSLGSLRVLLTVLAAAALALCVAAHTKGCNGPYYWYWPWRSISPWRLFPAMVLASLPFWVAQYAYHRQNQGVAGALLLLAVSTLLLELVAIGMQSDPFNLARIWQIIIHPQTTGYFNDALNLYRRDDLLQAYPSLLPHFHLHSHNKPPGLILFYIKAIQWFGPDATAALAGGLLIGVLAALAGPAVYLCFRAFGASRDAAFCGAGCMTLSAGLVLLFPEFDQIYPLLTCGLLGTWVLALHRDNLLYALTCGVFLSLATFMAYNLLVLGLFMAGYFIYRAQQDRSRRSLLKLAGHAGLVLLTVAGFYLVLWWSAGYDPLATFAAAHRNEKIILQALNRPYLQSIFYNLLDYALGMNWIVLIPALCFMAGKIGKARDEEFVLVLLCLAQVLVVSVLGLFRGETARLWLFMYPLLLFPAALELATWSLPARSLFFAFMLLLLIIICQNLLFINI